MAALAVIGFMLSSTATAAGVLGIIKRRCGASQEIVSLSDKCETLIANIIQLLKTLKGGAKVPLDPSSIATALSQRSDEFRDIRLKLDEINNHTKRASDKKRLTKNFILAQGWKQKLAGIYTDLQSVREGVETLVTVWENRRSVIQKVEEVVATIDVSKVMEQSGVLTWSGDDDGVNLLVPPTSTADRMLLTLVKLSVSDKKVLAKHGQLDKLSMPDALFRASWNLGQEHYSSKYKGVGISGSADKNARVEQLSVRMLQHAAELNHPNAHYSLGWRYRRGIGVMPNAEQSLTHFKVSSDAGIVIAMWDMSQVYFKNGKSEQGLKYLRMAAEHGHEDSMRSLVVRLSQEQRNGEYANEAKKWFSRCKTPLFESFCYFFGVGVEKDKAKSVQVCKHLNKFDNDKSNVELSIEGKAPNRTLHWWCPGTDYDILFERNAFSNGQIDRWIEYLFDSGLRTVALSVESRLFCPEDSKRFKKYGIKVALDGNVSGHLALAAFYSSAKLSNWDGAKKHLRLAAQAGNAQAESILRTLVTSAGSAFRGRREVDADERSQPTRRENTPSKK